MPRRLTAARSPVALVVLSALLLWGACSREPEAVGPLVMDQNEHERWEIALVEMRIEKNEDFARPGTTPLAEEALPGFEGLNYYFPEPDLRFRPTLERAAGTDTVKLTRGQGDVVPYIRRGTVSFRHDGRNHRLAVFGQADGGGDTSGCPSTTPATAPRPTPAAATWTWSWAPTAASTSISTTPTTRYCDYDAERWNCTLPPVENTLLFPVAAGEKRFSSAH